VEREVAINGGDALALQYVNIYHTEVWSPIIFTKKKSVILTILYTNDVREYIEKKQKKI
jgi:hypothetical protein